jgi:hypothetical protein
MSLEIEVGARSALQLTSCLGREIDSLQFHHVSAEDYVDGLSQASVLTMDWSLLTHLQGSRTSSS